MNALLWVAGLAFLVCWFFRLWWVAALITGAVAMAAQGGGSNLPLNTQIIGALSVAIPAFGGAALGKFMHKRKADPFDPTDLGQRGG